MDRSGNTLTISANGIVSSTGKSITFVRDAQNRITEIDDPNGNRLLYGYNGNELFTFQDAVGQLTRYGSASGLLYQVYPPGQSTPINFSFDGSGKLIGSTDPLNGQVQYTHDIANQVETIQDRNGNTTIYQYDGDGNVVKATNALGHVTTYNFSSVRGSSRPPRKSYCLFL